MERKQLLYSMLVAGLSLGTAWAIRGQFGHEQGAAWAGGIGGLAIVLLSKRADWYAKAFQLTLASAIGWGVGGIISYGKVVGYGRGLDFGNVYYGFVMLLLIGGLFGLLGGGLFGIALQASRQKPAPWPKLIVEMTAGAIIFYYLLIEEFGWLMTPPRSEAWAACLGMAAALFWFLIREKRWSSLRLAVFAGLGGGFGFAFGNFMQVIGTVSGIKFNFWNVMEYSIGFFGGLGMAYGTFTSVWEESTHSPDRYKLIAPVVILSLIVPFVVWDQSFETQRLVDTVLGFSPGSDAGAITRYVQWIAFILVLLFAGATIWYFLNPGKRNEPLSRYELKAFFFSYLGLYSLFSLLITFAFMSVYRIEQYLYVGDVLLLAFLIDRFQPTYSHRGVNVSRWTVNLLFILAFLAMLTAIAINSHGELKGAQVRFGFASKTSHSFSYPASPFPSLESSWLNV